MACEVAPNPGAACAAGEALSRDPVFLVRTAWSAPARDTQPWNPRLETHPVTHTVLPGRAMNEFASRGAS